MDVLPAKVVTNYKYIKHCKQFNLCIAKNIFTIFYIAKSSPKGE